jgi:hypothetical protein
MPKRTIIDSIKIIHDCAVLYGKNLAGKNLLFVTTLDDEAVCFEVLFLSRNFMHLTGVTSRLKGDLFYQAAIHNRLSVNDVKLNPDGTTEQKLDVLPQLMNLHATARMIGDYDNSRPLLIADKFAGAVTMAIGFIQINGLYIPRTALKVDVRSITSHATRRRVAAIFRKPRNVSKYSELTYIAKNVTINDDSFTHIMQNKIDMQNLISSRIRAQSD